jgi:large subunit ribosomal protein L10
MEVYRQDLTTSSFVLVTKYHGLSSEQLGELRKRLKSVEARFRVVRNTLFRKVIEQSRYEKLMNLIDGPTGIIVGKEVVSVSRVLCKFVEEHTLPVIRGGMVKDRLLDEASIQEIAKLPSAEVLRGQLVGTLAAPMIKVVHVLKARLSSLIFVLKTYAETKADKK